MRSIIIGAIIAAIGLVGGGLASSQAAAHHRHRHTVSDSAHYYDTTSRCGWNWGHFTSQPERSLRTYNDAFNRMDELVSQTGVQSVRITDANNGQIIAYSDANPGTCS